MNGLEIRCRSEVRKFKVMFGLSEADAGIFFKERSVELYKIKHPICQVQFKYELLMYFRYYNNDKSNSKRRNKYCREVINELSFCKTLLKCAEILVDFDFFEFLISIYLVHDCELFRWLECKKQTLFWK